MGRLSRTKGANREREFARKLTAAIGEPCCRNLEEVRSGNCGDIVSPLPMVFQVKIGDRPSVWRAINEALVAAEPWEEPVAAVTRNAKPGRPRTSLIVQLEDDWLERTGMLRREGIL